MRYAAVKTRHANARAKHHAKMEGQRMKEYECNLCLKGSFYCHLTIPDEIEIELGEFESDCPLWGSARWVKVGGQKE